MNRLRWRRVAAVTVAWMSVAALLAVHDHLTFRLYGEFGETYSFRTGVASAVLGAFLGGVLGGSLIVFYLKRSAPNRSFLGAILLHTTSVMVVIALVLVLVSVSVFWQQSGRPPGGAEFVALMRDMTGAAGLRVLLFWSVVVALTSLLLEVSDKYGPSGLRDFVLGRYHHPKVEQRCFMFLDLRSSTAIAEHLGHERYFALLRRCFFQMTGPIIETGGAIYQYVGDEVVLTWPLAKGLEGANCVRCYERIRAALAAAAPQYEADFGVTPVFKAGLHAGEVTTGEVGTIRKDIVFTGDVLNTAARIEGRCNALGHDLLMSGDVQKQLPETVREHTILLEDARLRGREGTTSLYAYSF